MFLLRLLRRAVFGVILSGALSAACAQSTDLVLEGEIRESDHQTYRLVPFDVPDGVTGLTIDFDYGGRQNKTVIDVGLLGPGDTFERAFRGWSGGSKRRFSLSAHDATPSYHPGPIAPGRWHLLLGVPNIRSGQISRYTARIRLERDTPAPPALRSGPAWYRGDLHMHSGHSDGSCNSKSGNSRVPCPLFLTLDAAADRGLDFIAVTEHNTNSHVRELTALQPYFDRLLLIPGMEITTFQGHVNAFNVLQPLDFRLGSPAVPDWNALLRPLTKHDTIVSINHPRVPSGEVCMGCGWSPREEVDNGLFNAIEVVNGHDVETPISGIAFWHEQLRNGSRLTAIGGSDTHDITSTKKTQPLPGRIGVPTTVVYATELSTPAILAGIRRGRVFVDTMGSRDRTLDVTATTGQHTAVMGESLRAAPGSSIRWRIEVGNLVGGKIEVLGDGTPLPGVGPFNITQTHFAVEFDQRADDGSSWLRIDVRDSEGRLALIGNPIYLDR